MALPDPGSGVVTSKDVIGWAITAVLFIITFAWNWLNRRHSDALARSIRKEAAGRDDWKEQRTVLLADLRDLEKEVDQLDALSRGGHDLFALRREVEETNKKLVAAHTALWRELGRVDEEWSALALGPIKKGESQWDLANTQLAAASAIGATADDVRQNLTDVVVLMTKILSGVQARVKQHSQAHLPN